MEFNQQVAEQIRKVQGLSKTTINIPKDSEEYKKLPKDAREFLERFYGNISFSDFAGHKLLGVVKQTSTTSSNNSYQLLHQSSKNKSW